MQLQEARAELARAGVDLVAVSYDAPAVLERAAARLGVDFPLLSDAGSRTIDAYGVRNREASGRFAGIPHPVFFVLDARGVVRAKLAHEGFRERHGPADLLRAARDLLRPADPASPGSPGTR